MDDRIPDHCTDEYSSYIDEVISELMQIKNSLKRGADRKANRKEVAHLQSAITALRHLKNKNNRKIMLLNNREKGINENFSSNEIRSFLMGKIPDDY
jgi:Mg2+ and Co2+ transporter CorA